MKIAMSHDDCIVVCEFDLPGGTVSSDVIREALISAGWWDCEECGRWFQSEPYEYELDFYCDSCAKKMKGDSHEG